MPKTPQRHGRTRASSGLAQGGTPNPADALNSGRTPPQIIHTYARKKLPRRRASSLLSIFSNFSDSLPPVEEVFSAIGKPLPPSAIDKINYHFRRLSKLASADTGQKFSDETAAFRQTLDTFYLEIVEESKAKTHQLSELAKVLEREGQCAICTACIHNPVTLGRCGHTFCALCIREHFRSRLSSKLSRFRRDNDIMQNIPLPETLAQLKKLSKLITFYRGDSTKIFSYQCPQCRWVVREAPVMAYQFRSLLSAARGVLSAHDDNTDDLPPVTATFFDGLFE